MTHCYVTGASGFLGKHVCEALACAGHRITAVSRKAIQISGCESQQVRTYKELKIDEGAICIHLAEGHVISEIDEARMQEQTALVEWLLQQPCAKIIYASSAVIYSDTSSEAHFEDETITASSLSNDYRRSKFRAEQLLLADDSRAHVILRLTSIYGRDMSPKTLIPTIVSQLDSESGVSLRSVKPIRDFLHVSDAARAVVAACQSKSAKGVFNIGSGDAISVHAVFERIVALSGKAEPTLTIADEAAPSSCIKVDIGRSKAVFKWQPKLTLTNGLQDFLEGKR